MESPRGRTLSVAYLAVLMIARLAPAQVVTVEPIRAQPGERVLARVVLLPEGTNTVALQFEVEFAEAFVVAERRGGVPSCTVNPEIQRTASATAFIPAGCRPGTEGNCSGLKVVVFDFFDRAPIPEGVILTCDIEVRAEIPDGTYSVPVGKVIASDAAGMLLPGARGIDGVLEIRQNEPTPTFTATPLPTATPEPTPAPLCPGDCNGDDQVTIDELVGMVAVALDERSPQCVAADLNGDGLVTIEEIIAAVHSALYGCP